MTLRKDDGSCNWKGFFMKKLLWYTLNLQLFSGEAAEGSSEATGENNADAGQKNDSSSDEFSQLINGKFKDEFTKKTQGIINQRFKQTKELELYKSKVSPTIQKLMEQHGLLEGEEEKLLELVSAPKEKTEDVNTDNQNKLKTKISSWLKEGEAFKQKNPKFDLRDEIKGNKLFSQMLLSGVPLETAYETVHRDEILTGAMQYTADAVRQQMVKNIEAKGRRPIENGISSESAVVTTVDVNSLTSQDILKILKQVENGANIRF